MVQIIAFLHRTAYFGQIWPNTAMYVVHMVLRITPIDNLCVPEGEMRRGAGIMAPLSMHKILILRIDGAAIVW